MSLELKTEKNPSLFGSKGEKVSSMQFTYFGPEKSVEIAGDFTGWKPCNLKFQEIGNSKILILNFSNNARVEYKLIVDGKWITDPLNPSKIDNGVGGENSFFTMRGYKPTPWDKGVMPRLYEFDIESRVFGKRTIKVFVPTGGNATVKERAKTLASNNIPVIYIEDGSDYANRAKAVQIQKNLVNAGKIRSFIMVFIDPQDRTKEYWANDHWADFMAHEVQSSSFWIDDERVVKELEKLDASKTKFRFYLDDGTLEGVDDSRKVVKILRDKGYDVTYVEGEAGHNWTAWRDRLADAFITLMK